VARRSFTTRHPARWSFPERGTLFPRVGRPHTKREDKQLRLIVLVNAAAGMVERKGVDALREALTSMFATCGVSASVTFAASADLRRVAEEAVARAQREGVDGIVVGGGDGTIRAVAMALAGTGLPLGVLPLGTLNHFARDVGIPPTLEGAVAVICAGNTRAVDVGDVNGEVFINNSGIGLYPFLVLDRDRRRVRLRLAKWSAMLLAGLRLWRRFPLRRLVIAVEGRAEPFRTPVVFVGNNEYGLSLAALGKRQRLDGATLWICVSKARTPAALLWVAVRAALGFIDRDRGLEVAQSASAEIRSRASKLLVALDGEVEIMRPPLRYRIRPAALRVFAPEPPP
jgi:diacylglycerol kinase family enzyme